MARMRTCRDMIPDTGGDLVTDLLTVSARPRTQADLGAGGGRQAQVRPDTTSRSQW